MLGISLFWLLTGIVTQASSLSGVIHGELELRGRRVPVDVAFTLNRIGNDPYAFGRKAGFSASARLARADFDDALPGLLALWIPGETPDPGQGGWLKQRFDGRLWLAAELHRGPDDAARLRGLQALAGRHLEWAGLCERLDLLRHLARLVVTDGATFADDAGRYRLTSRIATGGMLPRGADAVRAFLRTPGYPRTIRAELERLLQQPWAAIVAQWRRRVDRIADA